MNERELIEACREGDKVAEKELYQRYSGKLYTLCIRYAGNKEDALDYMHDAMLKGISSLSRFKYLGEGSFYRWLSRLTVNMILDLIRKQASFKMVSLSNVPEPSDENEYEACPPPPQDVLLKLISELPVERRTVFNMYCLEGYSHKEIANRLGITEKGSASILSKARAQLRERIIKYDKDGQSVG